MNLRETLERIRRCVDSPNSCELNGLTNDLAFIEIKKWIDEALKDNK